MDRKDDREAVKRFEKALAAPARLARKVAEAGRRIEVNAALARAREMLWHDS